MDRLKAISLVSVLAALAALGLSACGGGGADLLPGKTAEEINQNLDQVRALVDEGDCAGAEDAVGEVSAEVDGLSEVDGRLKAALREGTERLGQVVSSCEIEALEAEEAENAAAEEAELEEQEAVEAEEEQLAEEEQHEKQEKTEEKKETKEGKKEPGEENGEGGPGAGEEAESFEPPGQSEEHGKGPPPETPSGNEPPAGGVGPGAVVE